MIDRFSKNDLVELVRERNDPCVTIYLLTEKTGREIYKAATRLKQLAKTAQQKLASHSMTEAEAQEFLKPIVVLADDDSFWQETDHGLALFLNSGSLRKWRLAKPIAEQVFVSDRFFVRPLISTAHHDPQYFVLALSANNAELFKGDSNGIGKIDLPKMPASVGEAMNLTSVSRNRGSQVHTGSREFGGKQASVFHGHGGKSETSTDDVRFFFRQVNQAVAEYLAGKRNPLVLACVADKAPIYREVNTYPFLLEQIAAGNTDQKSQRQLHTRALKCVEEHMDTGRQSAIKSFQRTVDKTRTLSEASSILAAAYQGQVDTLLVNETATAINGAFNPADQTVDYDASTRDFDKDLMEEAIAQTLLHRGEVYALLPDQMPGNSHMVSTLRY